MLCEHLLIMCLWAAQIAGNPAIAGHSAKFMGIRNGIDIDIWDPQNDDLLPRPYDANSLVQGQLTYPLYKTSLQLHSACAPFAPVAHSDTPSDLEAACLSGFVGLCLATYQTHFHYPLGGSKQNAFWCLPVSLF